MTCLYELVDDRNDPNLFDTEANYGLLRNNLTEKPSYVALRNIIALLIDRGTT